MLLLFFIVMCGIVVRTVFKEDAVCGSIVIVELARTDAPEVSAEEDQCDQEACREEENDDGHKDNLMVQNSVQDAGYKMLLLSPRYDFRHVFVRLFCGL